MLFVLTVTLNHESNETIDATSSESVPHFPLSAAIVGADGHHWHRKHSNRISLTQKSFRILLSIYWNSWMKWIFVWVKWLHSNKAIFKSIKFVYRMAMNGNEWQSSDRVIAWLTTPLILIRLLTDAFDGFTQCYYWSEANENSDESDWLVESGTDLNNHFETNTSMVLKCVGNHMNHIRADNKLNVSPGHCLTDRPSYESHLILYHSFHI